ncbi:MAG TPA: DUF4382 domain-containing protein [Candidatus Binatus sp.]|nr:DUF4382 domain-containing protein [Candidatus Binatus sp.]
MTDYHYPFWRRGVFVALMILVLFTALVPPFSKGTLNVQVYSITAPGVTQHLYLDVSQMELHISGTPPDTGWVSTTGKLPTLDLVGLNAIASTSSLISYQIQSGRYDQVRISVLQARITRVGNGNLTSSVCGSGTAVCSPITVNATVSVPPNGFGNLLLVVSPDYSLLLSSPPSLSLSVVQVATP